MKNLKTTDAALNTVTLEQIDSFIRFLDENEKAEGTQQKYRADLRQFKAWLDSRPLTKAETKGWKSHLMSKLAARTVNSKLSALNGFVDFIGRSDCRVKLFVIQDSFTRSPSRDLTLKDYNDLKATALKLGKIRLFLILETLCALGIRISELVFITVEALMKGEVEIVKKGKIRRLFLPEALRVKLLEYAKTQKIASGAVFCTRSGKPISRGQVWTEMKALAAKANVQETKVHPHNFRHLFATTFYRECPDISGLANILGHSNIQTTRIYLTRPAEAYQIIMDRLGLVS